MLNKDDKKYLKENVEKRLDDLDKKVNDLSKGKSNGTTSNASNPNNKYNPSSNTQSGKRLRELLNKDKEKDDKEQLIEYLKEKQDKGEATLAQKLELINLSIKKAIPDDVRDALKETGAEIKKGASQVGKGASHLMGRVMGMNPITAMLWQNRDIAKAFLDMGIGGIKMGWGAIKGTAKGAAGLLNSAKNLFGKKKDAENGEDETVQEEGGTPSAPKGDSVEEKEGDGELTTAEKITEIHELLFKGKLFEKQENEEKKRQSVLGKGLAGLASGMKAINGVVSIMMNKQKEILTGIMLGAVAILALVGWFKGGGLAKALGSLLNDNQENDAIETGQGYLDTQAASKMSNDEVVNNLITPNNNAMTGERKEHKFGKFHGDEFRKYAKGLGVSHSVLNSDDASKHIITEMKEKETTTLIFGFPVMIIDKFVDKTDTSHISLRIKKCYYSTVDKQYKQASATITVTRVLQQLVAEHIIVDANVPIAIVDSNFQIIGDFNAFLATADSKDSATNFTDFVKNHNLVKNVAGDNYKNYRTEANKNKQQQQTVESANMIKRIESKEGKGLVEKGVYEAKVLAEGDKAQKFTEKDIGKGETTPQPIPNPSSKPNNISGNSPTVTQPVPKGDVNNNNNATKKVQGQQQAIKDTKQKPAATSGSGTTSNAAKNNTVVISGNSNTTGQKAETLDISQYNAATKPN